MEDILDECLHLMAQGQGVEECLSRYPEQAAELEPLLRTAAAVRQQAMASPRPSPIARAAGRQALLTAVADRQERRRPRFFPLRGWAVAMASLVLALFLGTGTVMASFQSVPEETLYPVKQAVERVQLALAPSPESRARTLVRHSDNRLKEIEALEKKGKVVVAEKLRERLKRQLQKATELVITVERRGGDGMVVVAAMEKNLARYRARLAKEKARTQAAMRRPGRATPPKGAVPEKAPMPSAASEDKAPVPAAAPATAQAPAATERQPKVLPPRTIRALEKALDDYEEYLERLKVRIEQHHQQKTPRPPVRPRR